ncbi:MAG: class I SAM-dependent methyltransferase [Dehalococcoidia bacterium]|jgi:SAM-dependent methyltransferase|nr:class I SAM-dependent methyltransferase [Dehalococcoidia bacterium]
MRKRLFAALYGRIEGRMRRSTERYRRRLVEGLTGRVLEIGCGPGGGFEYYNPAAMVTATDYSEHMLKRARGRGRRPRLGHGGTRRRHESAV